MIVMEAVTATVTMVAPVRTVSSYNNNDSNAHMSISINRRLPGLYGTLISSHPGYIQALVLRHYWDAVHVVLRACCMCPVCRPGWAGGTAGTALAHRGGRMHGQAGQGAALTTLPHRAGWPVSCPLTLYSQAFIGRQGQRLKQWLLVPCAWALVLHIPARQYSASSYTSLVCKLPRDWYQPPSP